MWVQAAGQTVSIDSIAAPQKKELFLVTQSWTLTDEPIIGGRHASLQLPL